MKTGNMNWQHSVCHDFLRITPQKCSMLTEHKNAGSIQEKHGASKLCVKKFYWLYCLQKEKDVSRSIQSRFQFDTFSLL